ncbi:MAG: DUF2889 domain-containing protein [Betaproteobacteria bacterium]|nr:DUF2889 domain-containing protein [Betaproteobacteria bacterium]
MTLSEPRARRVPLHRRSVEITGYKRDDGLFDIEGHLVDAKDIEFKVGGRVLEPRQPVHGMWLRITVDRELRIVDAEACTEAMPYPGHCDGITPAYAKLIGLCIGPGYLRRVKELLGGVRGCTHITELAGALATVTFQTFAGQGLIPTDRKPPQLDRCHALDSRSPVVGRFYPKWYRGAAAVVEAGTPEQH